MATPSPQTSSPLQGSSVLSTLSSPDLPAFLSSLPALAGSVEAPPVLLRLDQQDTTWGGTGPVSLCWPRPPQGPLSYGPWCLPSGTVSPNFPADFLESAGSPSSLEN